MRRLLVALALLLAAAGAATAEPAWPARAIRIVVPYAAGGNSDLAARIAAQYMQTALGGASVVVENKAGAGGVVATEAVAAAAPDGHTLLLGSTGPLTITPSVEKLSYDPLRDFAPISLISTNPLMLIAHPSVPATSVRALIELARSRPGTLHFGSSGTGGLTHVAGEMFKVMTGASLVHVPYRGGSLATAALVGGEVQLVFANYSDALPQIAAGTVRPLGISTVARSAQSPDVPTIVEAGLAGFEAENWNAILAPRGTPEPIIARLAQIYAAMAKDPQVQKRMIEIGSVAVSSSPDAFRQQIATELTRWSTVMTEAGIKLQ